jgi:hypothetical protein
VERGWSGAYEHITIYIVMKYSVLFFDTTDADAFTVYPLPTTLSIEADGELASLDPLQPIRQGRTFLYLRK